MVAPFPAAGEVSPSATAFSVPQSNGDKLLKMNEKSGY
jgi:hypothetical protein